jgi:uncharacterized membrane protein YfcA
VLWPVLALFGVLLGMVTATMGIGSGIISVPVLFAVYGIDYPVAVGTSLGLIVGTASLGAVGHARNGNVDVRLWLPLLIGIACGTLGGGWILDRLQGLGAVAVLGQEKPAANVVGALLFAMLLGWIGVTTLRKVHLTMRRMREGAADDQETGEREPPAWLLSLRLPPRLTLPRYGLAAVSVWPLVGVGVLAGLAAGMMGIGGGFLMVPVLLYWFRTRTLVAVGTSLAGIVGAAVCGTVQKYHLGQVDLVLAGILLLGGWLGILLGIKVTGVLPPHRLRQAYGVFCLCGVGMALAKLAL